MASRIVKSPLVGSAVKRQFSAQPSSSEVVKRREGMKVTTTTNGVKVVSLENLSPMTTVGVVLKAGSRNETYENTGVCHALRIAAGLGTKNHSAFSITRNVQQQGGNLLCVQGREHTAYMTQVPRSSLETADYVIDVVGEQAFKSWELADVLPRLQVDKPTLAVHCSELLHKAAYRDGLGNSLYAPDHMIGKHKSAMLQDFCNKNFTSDRAAVVGVGIDHETLLQYAEKLNLPKGSGKQPAQKYHGGEVRCDHGGKYTFVAVAGECDGAADLKKACANLVLERILGGIPRTPYAAGLGKMTRAANTAAGGDKAISGYCYLYTDSGLLGGFIGCEAAEAGKTVEAVVKTIRDASVTEEQVQAAKNGCLVDWMDMGSSSCWIAENIGWHMVTSGKTYKSLDTLELLKGVSLADVQMCMYAMFQRRDTCRIFVILPYKVELQKMYVQKKIALLSYFLDCCEEVGEFEALHSRNR